MGESYAMGVVTGVAVALALQVGVVFALSVWREIQWLRRNRQRPF